MSETYPGMLDWGTVTAVLNDPVSMGIFFCSQQILVSDDKICYWQPLHALVGIYLYCAFRTRQQDSRYSGKYA